MHESICIFAEIIHAFTGVVEHHAFAGVYHQEITLVYICRLLLNDI